MKKPFSPIVRASAVSAARPVAHKVEETIFSDNPLPIRQIPQANFWSFTLYDNMTRSMLDTPQRYPRAGSQSFPSPAAEANADGTTTVYFGPTQPANVTRGNWIQTMPGKGFIPCLRLYSPLEPFFAKTWRPSEVEPVQ